MANENEDASDKRAECCEDWTEQVRKIDSFIVFQSVRAGRDLYDGIPFRFCPWCGKQRPQGAAPTTTVAAPKGD